MSIPGYLTDTEIDRLKRDYPHLCRPGHCPTCNDTKRYRWQGQDHICLCDEQKRLLVRYLHAGIGLTYQRLSWADVGFDLADYPQLTDYMDNAAAYIDRGIGLIVHGPVGTGKTLLMNLILKELVKAKYDCYSTTFAGAVENFTATWGDKAEKQVFAKRFMGSQVLGLDDLGKEQRASNRLPQTTFDYILRSRVQSARPTIVTTNMGAMELVNGYGGAVLSLLVESSVEIELKGADFRPRRHDMTLAEIKAGETRPIV